MGDSVPLCDEELCFCMGEIGILLRAQMLFALEVKRRHPVWVAGIDREWNIEESLDVSGT